MISHEPLFAETIDPTPTRAHLSCALFLHIVAYTSPRYPNCAYGQRADNRQSGEVR